MWDPLHSGFVGCVTGSSRSVLVIKFNKGARKEGSMLYLSLGNVRPDELDGRNEIRISDNSLPKTLPPFLLRYHRHIDASSFNVMFLCEFSWSVDKYISGIFE